MKTIELNINPIERSTTANCSGKEAVVDYYTEAGMDYKYWSEDFNMHFGFAAKAFDCWNRETMLQRMNEIVLSSLGLEEESKVLDMGCGLGATIRYGGSQYGKTLFKGITITPWQVEQANKLIVKQKLRNVEVLLGNYNDLPFEDNSLDATYGLESICHADGPGKDGPIKEAFRVLKSGGKFVMVDGFLKKKEINLSPLVRPMYNIVCENWALPCFPEIDAVSASMQGIGFKEITIEEISWKIAPSAVHAPFISLYYLIHKMIKGEKLERQNWRNLKACFMIFFLGLFRKSIGYYKITAKK